MHNRVAHSKSGVAQDGSELMSVLSFLRRNTRSDVLKVPGCEILPRVLETAGCSG